MSDSKNRPPQTQDCSCTATPAAAGSLADLLLEVPLIMEIMDDKSWSAVSACSRQLRQLVQSKTRVVHAYIPIDINLLIKHTRAGLCLICQGDYHADVFGHGMLWPENDALELEAVITFTDRPHEAQVLMVKPTSHQREDQLACHTNHLHQWTQRRNWTTDKVTGMQQNSTGAKEMAQLNALGLPPIRKLQIAVGHLDKAAITHLVAGNFRFLFQLNLSNNNLDAATLQLLAKGSWHHLEVLNLSGNKLDKETMSHLCANGWPLHVLVLRGTSLTSSAIAVLASKISERLCTLDLADNKLDEAAMQQLVQGKWLKLQSLNLSDNSVNDADIEHLVKGSCPKMDTLLVERTCITLCGMQRLFAAQWPCRESLVVTTTYSPSTAQSKLLQECMAYKYVVIKSDTDFTSFTTGNQAAENKCFTTCTRRFRNNLLGRRAW